MLRQRHRTPSPLVANCCLLHQLRDSVASWPSLLHQAVSNPLDRHAAKTRSWFGPFFFAANTSPLPKKIPTPVQRRSLPPLSKQDPSLRKQTPLFLRRLPSEEDHPLLLFALRGGGDWATGFVKDPPLKTHPIPTLSMRSATPSPYPLSNLSILVLLSIYIYFQSLVA